MLDHGLVADRRRDLPAAGADTTAGSPNVGQRTQHSIAEMFGRWFQNIHQGLMLQNSHQYQGTLTKVECSVQLISSLGWLVL